ncbi:MAG: energy-coupling factor ABC transporter permease [Desulfuromonadaceae bacterium]|nr:energy-coupling factor ABC transporter permease [Desulfuromonadaceae bacterium]
MHMADALLSPAVGGTMWGVTAGAIAYCSQKVRTEMDDRRTPLMGVLGAFIFAAQMINFTIPVTGSSGHLGGGLILSILLGPYAAFLTIASVLVVQAFFFADGGLLALGCNIFNLGLIPAFIAYPLFYKKIVGNTTSPTRISAASMIAAIIALQMGSLGVVLETVSSGISSLPFTTFVLIMQPIHLAIGIVEGLVTASVVSFVYNAKPEIIRGVIESHAIAHSQMRNTVLGFMVATLLMGGVVSWFASDQPDGLEWSITRVTGQKELNAPKSGIYKSLALLQEKLSLLPDYSFRKPAGSDLVETAALQTHNLKLHEHRVSGLGTSVSGIAGGTMTLGLLLLIGFMLKQRNRIIPDITGADGQHVNLQQQSPLTAGRVHDIQYDQFHDN